MINEKKAKPKVYGLPTTYNSQYTLLKKALDLYACVINSNGNKETYLRPRLMEVLAFYMLFDINNNTMKLVEESLSINRKNLIQINSELVKKGCIVRDQMNFRKKFLSEEMQQFKQYFLSNENKKFFLIPLSKKKNG